jgi:hypothetical protein
MSDADKREPLTLKRWSQRKLAAAREAHPAPAPAEPPEDASVAAPAVAADAPAPQSPDESRPSELPPIDSLTIDSDFSAFMRPDVDETLKRGALRKLFNDPRFNVMDGLDVYIDDYSKPDPIAPEIVRQLVQARYIFDPPVTRVNADGHVEDVPTDEAAKIAAASATDGSELPPPVATETLPAASDPHSSEPSMVQAELPIEPGGDSRSQ